jgi:DNA-binding NtrC family response regulator
VLLIEDEPIIAWEVESKLHQWGFSNVIVKESMTDSKELLLSDQCDIVISNLRLIDGWVDYDFAELLKRGKTHLILLTGLSSKDLHKVDWSPIQPKFLFKPYTSFQLKQILET